MPVPVISLYAGLLGLLALVLAADCGRIRGRLGVSVGDGGHPELTCAMRRHANFIEWVPLSLILLLLLELSGVARSAIHGLGAALVLARILHAIGLKTETMKSLPRALGAGGTALILLISALWLIILCVRR